MAPSNTVSGLKAEQRDDVSPQTILSPLFRRSTTTSEETPMVPTPGAVHAPNELLDPKKLDAVRAESTKAQLDSNFWFEVSRVALWTTTALIALTAMTFAGVGFMAGISFMLPLVGALISSVVLIKSSQHSKRIFTDRMFDVQDYQMQRQAALIGHSVEKAVDTHEHAIGASKVWGRHEGGGHAARLEAQNALSGALER